MANRSSTLRLRSRPPLGGGRDRLLVGVDVDAPVGALARAEHADRAVLLEAGAMTPRDCGGSEVGLGVRVLRRVTSVPGHRPQGDWRRPLAQAAPRTPGGAGVRLTGHCITTTTTPVRATWARASGDEQRPGELLQLVLAQAGVGHAEPDHDERRGRRLEQGPDPAELVGAERPVPAAEEEDGGQSRHRTTMPAYSASRNSANRRPVYSVYGAEDDLGVGDGHVERRPLELGERRRRRRRRRRRSCQGSHHHSPRVDDAAERDGAGGHGDGGGGEHASAARRRAAARRCAGRRGGRTCWRWPSRP